jgi:hypothetical protein
MHVQSKTHQWCVCGVLNPTSIPKSHFENLWLVWLVWLGVAGGRAWLVNITQFHPK